MISFPVSELRAQFPALERAGDFIFFDNAAGAQIPASVLAAVIDHLVSRNVQRGGPYGRSQDVDAMIVRARQSVAALVNARAPEEIAFGLNATSFIRAISLAVGQTLGDRSEIIVSDGDHEANVATWLALERNGARIVWWPVRKDGRLHPADLDALLNERTRLVACTVASNATGSLVDVADVARRAHRVGAEVFLDAVHYAPHGPLDVQALDCDYLVCSGYKIFAPHMGFAWCRPESMRRLPTFREDFIPDEMPYKLEAGTYAYENVAGMDAAVTYLAAIGRIVAEKTDTRYRFSTASWVRQGMDAIAAYERTLSAAMLDALASIPGVIIHGVTDRTKLSERVPTMCFTVEGVQSAAIADALSARGIGARSGHMYSPRLIDRLGLSSGGAVRASLVHYNTLEEVTRFREMLAEIVELNARTSPSAG
jgi:cysteine desulfurase family protein (TIGR01976 family)